jgi:serine/threonine protein kinase
MVHDLHQRLVVDRDVKPWNVLEIGPSGTPKLCDFGLGRVQCRVPSGWDGAGTRVHRAPGRPKPRADVGALSATFFEFATGREYRVGVSELAQLELIEARCESASIRHCTTSVVVRRMWGVRPT